MAKDSPTGTESEDQSSERGIDLLDARLKILELELRAKVASEIKNPRVIGGS